ncbi:TadE/TadG family type IV pilus assembly protein [Hamadaea sp. NPDC050747]|uniref:TadE/TadG family type IV pilus assembly protein n=1 Tax=Hamadaea sp. NPDC050747 TaxID=3155789 RepID=UPI0033F59A0E
MTATGRTARAVSAGSGIRVESWGKIRPRSLIQLRRSGGTTTAGKWSRGTIAVELAILTPAVLAFFASAIIAGRYAIAKQAADAASFDAARTASQARTARDATNRALAAAQRSFDAQGITCRTPADVDVDVSGFGVPVGQPASVRVTVTCDAELGDVALPGMPGTIRLSSTFVSPLDTYRTRS